MARAFDHTKAVCLDVKNSPKMSRTKSKAVSDGNDPIPQDTAGYGKLTMAEIHRA